MRIARRRLLWKRFMVVRKKTKELNVCDSEQKRGTLLLHVMRRLRRIGRKPAMSPFSYSALIRRYFSRSARSCQVQKPMTLVTVVDLPQVAASGVTKC